MNETTQAALASAPGKLIALGEYAVLSGSRALVLAVDRRAVAHRAEPGGAPLTSFLAHAEARCAAELGPPTFAIRVDTRAMRTGSRKLGLGSSAAATVAYIAARFAVAGRAPTPELIHPIAHRAHGDASEALGARGSGADIAASCFGSVSALTPADTTPRVDTLPTDVTWVALDSGRSADTRELVGAVETFAKAEPDEHSRLLARISGAADQGIAALLAHDRAQVVTAFEHGLAHLDALGAAAGLELVTETHRNMATAARRHGGAAKPTGAGGGDAALAVFVDEADARRFCVEMRAAGIEPLDLGVDPRGIIVFPEKSG